jgi:galactokinase
MRERLVAWAPGRVNLIGEHTDYNDGLALPFAIGLGVTVVATPVDEPRITVVAHDLGERDEFDFATPPSAESGWRAFVRGVAVELEVADGWHLEITSDLPQGAGLSSSAALCAALSLTLDHPPKGVRPLTSSGDAQDAACGRSRLDLARIGALVENRWVGAQTGMLDHLAVLLAEPGHALRLDLRDLGVTPVPLDVGDWTLAVLDSGAQHSNAEGGYNARRAECEEAADRLGRDSLRGASSAVDLPDPLDRRVRHVVTENERVDATVDALRSGDLERVGALLDASHASLRDDFDASVPEVEATVAAAKEAGAAGARMVGGGFGGSVLALFPPGVAPPDDALVVSPGGPADLKRT